MSTRLWNVRHKKTNLLVGRIALDLPDDVLESRYSPRSYVLTICSPVVEGPVMGGCSDSMVRPDNARTATIWLNTRRSLGTLWVDKATELYGHQDYQHIFSLPEEAYHTP